MTLDVAVEESTEVSIVKLISPVDQAIANIRAQEPEGRSRAERMALWIFDYLKDSETKKAAKLEKIAAKLKKTAKPKNDYVGEPEKSDAVDEFESKSDSDLKIEVNQAFEGGAVTVEDTKSEALKDDSPTGWLTEAISKAANLTLATHIAKGIHTSDKGTRGFIAKNHFPDDIGIVGTHSMGANMDKDDAASTASALSLKDFPRLVFEENQTLLEIERENLSILELSEKSDADFIEALNILKVDGVKFVEAISKIGVSSDEVVLTYRGKQVYQFVGEDVLADADFHVLSVYFQSSLVHEVWKSINPPQEADVKEARDKKFKVTENSTVVPKYSNIAHMKIGGEQPQNAGTLNSKRSGIVMMLGCIPPKWTASKVRPAYKVKSIFDILKFDSRVKRVVDDLAKFLLTCPPSNLGTRRRRDAHTNELIDLVVDFGEIQRTQDSGWSVDPRCHLMEHHKALVDNASGNDFDNDRFSQDFANWLNLMLRESFPLDARSTAQFKKMALIGFGIYELEKSTTKKEVSVSNVHFGVNHE